KRTVVVGTVGGKRRQPVRMMVRTHQVIGCRFRRRVGAVGCVGSRFGKRSIVWTERTVHLVGRYMQKPERNLFRRRKTLPILPRLAEQAQGTDYVCLNELFRPENGAIDMTFGSKVDDGARA